MICDDNRELWEEYWSKLPQAKDEGFLEHEWHRQLYVLGYRCVPTSWYVKEKILPVIKIYLITQIHKILHIQTR